MTNAERTFGTEKRTAAPTPTNRMEYFFNKASVTKPVNPIKAINNVIQKISQIYSKIDRF